MAEVNITLSDTDEDGGVNLRVEFDPPVTQDQEELTQAQAEGALVLEIIRLRAEGNSLAQIAEQINEEDYGTIIPGTAEVTEGEWPRLPTEGEKN